MRVFAELLHYTPTTVDGLEPTKTGIYFILYSFNIKDFNVLMNFLDWYNNFYMCL